MLLGEPTKWVLAGELSVFPFKAKAVWDNSGSNFIAVNCRDEFGSNQSIAEQDISRARNKQYNKLTGKRERERAEAYARL